MIVGTDGSIRARYAVLQAARIAQLHSRPLRIITVHSPLFAMTAFNPEPSGKEIARLETILRDSKNAVLDSYNIDIQTEWVVGDASSALVEASKEARAVIVGARGHGTVHRMLVGSVATKVARLAHSPVYVLREGDFNPDGPVTVGLSPAEPSLPAVECGMRAARVERTSLQVLRAHQDAAADLSNMPEGKRKNWLRGEIARSVSDTEARFDEIASRHEDVSSLFVHIQAHATDSLIDASRISRLVVIAPNDREPAEKTLGSVALAVLHHVPAVLVAR